MRRAYRCGMKKLTLSLALLMFLAACSRSADPAPVHQETEPAVREAVANESRLLDLTLSDEAQSRLGIKTTPAVMSRYQARRLVGGEIIVPPSEPGGLPTTSTTDLAQRATQQAAADGDVARAKASLELAELAYERADSLVRAEAGSVRARDEAANARAAAQASLDAAKAQRRLLGPAIENMNSLSELWVRVPVDGRDVPRLDQEHAAEIVELGDRGDAVQASPVVAPPAADFAGGTSDFFYALENDGHRWRVGQRVAVELRLKSVDRMLVQVPLSSLVYDIYGGTWVYVLSGPHRFRRNRVDIAGSDGSRAYLARGVKTGVSVVSTGAAELFGAEFGVGH